MNLDKPKSVRLEACTICQLKCKSCYMRNQENSIGTGYLKFENFKNFVDQNNFIENIELSNSGEIFLNPDLLKIIKYAHEKGVTLTAYNGVNFNDVSEEMIEALVKYNFQKITFSIDGTTQESYSKYRVGGNFNKVIENIKKLNSHKEKYNSTLPELKYQFIIFGHNEKEIPEAKRLAKELNMEINFKFNWDRNFSPIQDLDFVQKELEEYNKPKNCEHKIQKSYCIKMWTQPQINWDGRLLGCCCASNYDYEANVFEIGLENALKSEKFYYSKQMLMGQTPSDTAFLCARCGNYHSMVKNNDYVKKEEIIEYLK